MKKLSLALTVLGSVIASSLTALATKTVEITTGTMIIGITITMATGTGSEAIGVITITSMNSSEWARIGAAFEPRLRTKASLSTRNMRPRCGAIRQAAKALGQFIPA